jgi:hypothetical protein
VRGGIADPLAAPVKRAIDARLDQAEALLRRSLRLRLHYSAILGTLLERRLRALDARNAKELLRYREALASKDLPLFVTGPPMPAGAEGVLETCVRAWQEGARGMQALCRARGIHYLHVLQPARDDPGSRPPAHADSLRPADEPWARTARAGYPLLREAAAELVADGVNLVDATRLFASVEGDVFTDGCHLTQEGLQTMARCIVDALVRTMP